MIVYAESSALLTWLLDQPAKGTIGAILAEAEQIVASVLTPLECGRTLRRNRRMGRLPEGDAEQAERLLRTLVAGWSLVGVTDDIMDRALGPFPAEPVRTLDALHLATADFARESLGPLTMLSLDQRVRRNAEAIGLSVAPSDVPGAS